MLALTLETAARTLHVLAALVWIGHNYANVVQSPRFQAPALVDTAAVDAYFMRALQREHGTFRWASVVVWASGMYMLWSRGILLDVVLLTDSHIVLGLGAWSGTVMVLNLWLVLWPHQKRVLGFVPATTAERLRAARVTFLSSRTNTMLSIPTVLFMVFGAHASQVLS